MTNIVRFPPTHWPDDLERREAEWDTVDPLGIDGAETIMKYLARRDNDIRIQKIIHAVAGWLCVVALALMFVAVVAML